MVGKLLRELVLRIRNYGWKFSRLLPEFPNLDYQWTKGHANDEGNNLVDELLNKTMDQMD